MWVRVLQEEHKGEKYVQEVLESYKGIFLDLLILDALIPFNGAGYGLLG